MPRILITSVSIRVRAYLPLPLKSLPLLLNVILRPNPSLVDGTDWPTSRLKRQYTLSDFSLTVVTPLLLFLKCIIRGSLKIYFIRLL